MPEPNPTTSPSGQQLCLLQISGNAGLDYGNELFVIISDGQPQDTNSQLYAAGRYRPTLNELDCIGIVPLNTGTQETFHPRQITAVHAKKGALHLEMRSFTSVKALASFQMVFGIGQPFQPASCACWSPSIHCSRIPNRRKVPKIPCSSSPLTNTS